MSVTTSLRRSRFNPKRCAVSSGSFSGNRREIVTYDNLRDDVRKAWLVAESA